MDTSIHFDRVFGTLDPRSPTPLYEQIAACVRVAVATGRLRSHSPLPSVRQLASRLRINPSTVVGAYRDLEREGFAYTKRGSGTFVAAIARDAQLAEQSAHAAVLIDTLLQDGARSGIPAEALLEVLLERVGAVNNV